MEMIIKTGFENVSHNINFQPVTMSKGKLLVTANHVCNVQENRINGQSYLIQADVIRQTSVSLKPYSTKLNIDVARKVTGVSCTCVYNQSGKCKHIAALIYYVNNEESLSKTDFEQQWGKPTVRQLTQEKYSKGRYFCEMFPPLKKIVDVPLLNFEGLEEPSALHTLMLESKKNRHERAVKNLMDFMLDEVVLILEKESCANCLDQVFAMCERSTFYGSPPVLNQEVEDYYNRYIVLSRKDIIDLCCETIQQSKCPKWFKARSLRISASSSAHNIKIRSKKPMEKLVHEMLHPSKIDLASLRFGRTHEQDAKKEYEEVFHVSVIKVGLIVSEEQPWLCASLDGVVMLDGHIIKLVEFKCPSSCEKLPIVDYLQKKCNVKYLHFKEDTLYLKTSSQYYTQCQFQMYITGINSCDLYMYSPVIDGSCCITIVRDEKFLKAALEKCLTFYFHYLLPTLTSKEVKVAEKRNNEFIRNFTGADISNIM